MLKHKVLELDDVRVELSVDASLQRVELKLVLTGGSWHPKLPLGEPAPLVKWAFESLDYEIERMLAAQADALPYRIGEEPQWDENGDFIGFHRDHDALMALLEACSPEKFSERLHAPDVVTGIAELLAGSDRAKRKRLRDVSHRLMASRRGAPPKKAAARVDLRTAREVATEEVKLAKAFEAVKALRGPRRLELAQSLLSRQFCIQDFGVVTILARGRSLRAAAIAVVAGNTGRQHEAVKRAAVRGRKHPDFIPNI